MRKIVRIVAITWFFSGLAVASLRGAEPEARNAAAESESSAPAEKSIKMPVKITISKETTYLTEPLRPDGYVDYVAALNQECSAGVTPENNAAVMLWQVFDSSKLENREAYFQALGVPLPLVQGTYFTEQSTFIDGLMASQAFAFDEEAEKARDAAYRQFELAGKRPWSREECPLAARWLEINAEPIERVVEMTQRPRYWSPMIESGNFPLLSGCIPPIAEIREAGRVLLARAMQRLRAGQIEAARDDLRAFHRLARLVDQGPFLIDGLVACAMDGIAVAGDLAVAHFGTLTAEQIRRIDAECSALKPLKSSVDRLDRGERLFFLDSLAAVARGGLPLFRELLDSSLNSLPSPPSTWSQALFAVAIDWNETLRIGNQWFDRHVAAARLPTMRQRAEALDALTQEAEQIEDEDPWDAITSLLHSGPRTIVGEKIGQVFVCLAAPMQQSALRIDDRDQVRRELVHVALMLEAWRADHGGVYPAKLDELVPNYLTKLPLDPWSGAPYRYLREPHGYAVYSIGPNQQDEQGRNPATDGDAAEDGKTRVQPPPGDDITIRMPPNE